MRGYGRACVGVCVYFGNTQSSLPGKLSTAIGEHFANRSSGEYVPRQLEVDATPADQCVISTSEGQSARCRDRAMDAKGFGNCEIGWAVIIHETPGLVLTSSLCCDKQIMTCNWKLD